MIINIYILKQANDVLNLHITEAAPEQIATEPEQSAAETQQAPEETSASKPYPIGSPEAAAAIERVKAAEQKRKTGAQAMTVKRGRKKKTEE